MAICTSYFDRLLWIVTITHPLVETCTSKLYVDWMIIYHPDISFLCVVCVCVCASWKSATASHRNSAAYFFSISLLLLVFGVVCCCDELFTSCLRESVIRMVNMIFFSFFSKPIRKYVKQRLLWVIHSHFSIWWTFFGSVIQLSNTDKFELSAYVRCMCDCCACER